MELLTHPPTLPPRQMDAHKGTFGKVLVVVGSRGMSGAAILTGSAALRSGAGLVQVCLPAEVQGIVALGNPCYTTSGLAQTDAGQFSLSAFSEMERLAESADVIAFGPGVGQSDSLPKLVAQIVRIVKPLILDADGLNALATLPPDSLRSRAASTVLTPHPGEFSRLIGKPTSEVQANRQQLAAEFAAERGVILLLKGHGSIVTDGRKMYVNATGNPGMATGGSGDVLTGVIAALIAQGLAPFDAAALGAFIHGKAGDLAAEEFGQVSMIATDIVGKLAGAFQGWKSSS